MSINKVILIGQVVSILFKSTTLKRGTPFVVFKLKVQDELFKVVAFGGLAKRFIQNISMYARTWVYIEGSLHYYEFVDYQGKKQRFCEIYAHAIKTVYAHAHGRAYRELSEQQFLSP